MIAKWYKKQRKKRSEAKGIQEELSKLEKLLEDSVEERPVDVMELLGRTYNDVEVQTDPIDLFDIIADRDELAFLKAMRESYKEYIKKSSIS